MGMPTLSCLVAPPCTLVLLIVCKRRSLPWLPLPSRSRLLLLLRGSTLSGSEVPSWLPLHLPTDVDHQARIRRMRPIHCPQEVLLISFSTASFISYLSDCFPHRI